ncbi:MAG: nucleotidyltransferase domain-containing protein [Thermosynechococcaceae cyanobacterium]
MVEVETRLQVSQAQIAEFCQRWDVVELWLFGSALRDDFRPESDVDLLFRFAPGVRRGLLALAQMREELKELFDREIDLVSRNAIEKSRNWIRKENILSTAQVIYAAR